MASTGNYLSIRCILKLILLLLIKYYFLKDKRKLEDLIENIDENNNGMITIKMLFLIN